MRTRFFALKADMSKAYDRLEWHSLIHALHLIGFPLNFINLIKTCVYTSLIEWISMARSTGFFRPERGLRQWCILSLMCLLYIQRSYQYYFV